MRGDKETYACHASQTRKIFLIHTTPSIPVYRQLGIPRKKFNNKFGQQKKNATKIISLDSYFKEVFNSLIFVAYILYFVD
jgi:hypothetical protein